MTQEMLAASWRETALRAGVAAPNVKPLFDDLCRRYSEPGRAYHNLDHVAAMLDTVSRFGEDLHDPVAVRLTVWFHDAVYDPKRGDNEDQSAAYAVSALRQGRASSALLAIVESLILATKNHVAPPDDTDCQLLLDADLAILGADAAEYDRYAQAIREEYAWVPDADYRAGRTKVLAGFLERERLYHAPSLSDAWEAAARANLQREIETLA